MNKEKHRLQYEIEARIKYPYRLEGTRACWPNNNMALFYWSDCISAYNSEGKYIAEWKVKKN